MKEKRKGMLTADFSVCYYSDLYNDILGCLFVVKLFVVQQRWTSTTSSIAWNPLFPIPDLPSSVAFVPLLHPFHQIHSSKMKYFVFFSNTTAIHSVASSVPWPWHNTQIQVWLCCVEWQHQHQQQQQGQQQQQADIQWNVFRMEKDNATMQNNNQTPVTMLNEIKINTFTNTYQTHSQIYIKQNWQHNKYISKHETKLNKYIPKYQTKIVR